MRPYSCHVCNNTQVLIPGPGVQKKYRVAIFYKWCNISILRHGKYNFNLGVCKVPIQYVKGNHKAMTARGMGQKGLGWKDMRVCKFVI